MVGAVGLEAVGAAAASGVAGDFSVGVVWKPVSSAWVGVFGDGEEVDLFWVHRFPFARASVSSFNQIEGL